MGILRNFSKWMHRLKDEHRSDSVIQSPYQYLWHWRTIWNLDRAEWIPSTLNLIIEESLAIMLFFFPLARAKPTFISHHLLAPWHSQSKNFLLSSYLAGSKASSPQTYLSLLPKVLLIRGKDTSSSDITSNISVALWQLFWYKIMSSNNYCCHLLLHCEGLVCFPSQGFWDCTVGGQTLSYP